MIQSGKGRLSGDIGLVDPIVNSIYLKFLIKIGPDRTLVVGPLDEVSSDAPQLTMNHLRSALLLCSGNLLNANVDHKY